MWLLNVADAFRKASLPLEDSSVSRGIVDKCRLRHAVYQLIPCSFSPQCISTTDILDSHVQPGTLLRSSQLSMAIVAHLIANTGESSCHIPKSESSGSETIDIV